MTSQTPRIGNVTALADAIEADIRRRGLKSGDSYLKAEEAAKQFKVGTRTANRALQLLARRRIITRRQRAGTTISLTHHDELPESRLNVVHLLVHETHLKKEGMLTDGLVLGIQDILPKANIQLNYLREIDEAQYVNTLIDAALKSKLREGFVLIRSSIETQRTMGRSGLPAVVHGTVCPSVDNVSSIDADQAQAGQLVAEHFLGCGCRKMLVIMRNVMFPGDHLFLDQLRRTAYEGGIGDNSAIYRFMAPDEDAIEREVQRLMKDAFSEKCGVLCYTHKVAERLSRLIKLAELPRGQHPEIVLSGYYAKPGTRAGFPFIRQQISPEELGKRIANLLIEQSSVPYVPKHDRYPVGLVLPE